MSAFVCHPKHFKLLGVAGATHGKFGFNVNPRWLKHPDTASMARVMGLTVTGHEVSDHELATLYATILYAENLRSYSHRYPEDAERSTAEIIVVSPGDMNLYRPHTGPFTAAMLLKQCNCLDYQSCETDDWEKTAAFELLTKIRDAICCTMLGYDAAPWGFDGLPVKVQGMK